MKKTITILSFVFAFIFQSQAQKSMVHLDYSMATPLGDVKELADDFSFRGFDWGLMFFTNENIALGIGGNWNTFYEKTDRDTYNINEEDFSGAITTTQWNYAYFSSIYAYVGYYFGDFQTLLRPFVQLGIGSVYVEELKALGVYTVFGAEWAFGLKPTLGLVYELPDTGMGINAQVGYNWNSYNGKLITDPSYVNFSAGITFYP